MRKCDHCGKVIRFLFFEKDKLTEYTTRAGGTRDTERYVRVSICLWCVILESLISWVKAHPVLAVVLILGPFALIWVYALSWEARSQETSVTYRNPDFPCVTAIDPTVTDFACVAAIAGRH
jgi:Flp pilus assembly protein TadB